MNGTELWRAVKREFKKQHPKGSTIHRVENTLENGMSDCVWGANGKMGWIELKGEGDDETPLQRTFRRKWERASVAACVLMARWDKFIVMDGYGVSEYDTLAEAITCMVGG